MALLWDQRGLTWGSGGPRTRRIGPRTASAPFAPARAGPGMRGGAQTPVLGKACTTPEPAPTWAPKRPIVVLERVFAQCVRVGHSVSLRVVQGDSQGREVGGGSL